MVDDACAREAKRKFRVYPSARAGQFIAKCRRAHGHVRKTEAGKSLRRWQREKWVNTKTGRPCGNSRDRNEYCRPTKRVSSKTPKTASEMSAAEKRRHGREKSSGARASRAS
jgi:hypothetical protein